MSAPTQHYKVCPACQTPTAVAASTCARCGHVFRTPFTSPPPATAPPPPTQLYSPGYPYQAAVPRWHLVLFAYGLGVLLGGLIIALVPKYREELVDWASNGTATFIIAVVCYPLFTYALWTLVFGGMMCCMIPFAGGRP
jgi:hypothetical protein